MHIVRKLRLDRGWSQEDLAEISGVSVRTIQRLENGGRASLETLKCLAAVFESELSELRENITMNTTDESAPGIGRAQAVGLSEEDRAAIRFARQLRRYTEMEGDDVSEEMEIREQVRAEGAFRKHVLIYVLVMALLTGIDLMTSPGIFWAIWPMLGWGVGVVMHALFVYSHLSPFGKDWERSQIEERLARLACEHNEPEANDGASR